MALSNAQFNGVHGFSQSGTVPLFLIMPLVQNNTHNQCVVFFSVIVLYGYMNITPETDSQGAET